MPYIRELGINSTKISLYWHQIEPEKDVYNWTLVDAYVNQLKDGEEALLNVFTSSDWGAEGVGKGYPPLDYDEYYEFIYDLVKRTKGKVKYWQRDTEPASQRHWEKDRAEEYVKTQKYFYNAVKAANPDAIVIDVSANGFFTNGEPNNAEFFEYVLKEGKDYFDVLDVRLYGDKYTIPERVQWFRNKMREYGYEKPIVTTEYAGPTPFEFPEEYASIRGKYHRLPLPLFIIWLYFQKWTHRLPPQMEMFLEDIDFGFGLIKKYFTDEELEEKRHRIECRDIISRTLLALWSGVEKCWWWNLIARKHPVLGIHHPIFGKLRLMEIEDWSKRPAFYAYQRMVEKLKGLESIERIDVGNEDIFLFKVKKDEEDIYVLWERRDLFYGENLSPTFFEFDCSFKKALVTDVFGNEEVIETKNGILKLNISDTPVYIEEYPMKIALMTKTNGYSNASFIGIDSHPYPMYDDMSFLDKFSEVNINSFGVEFVIWNVIEPSPPINNTHQYEWDYLDTQIKKVERANGKAILTIWVASNWANKEGFDYDQYGFRPSIPPKREYWNDFGEFVKAVVERCDYDGIDYLQWVMEIPQPIPGWVVVRILDDNNPNRGVARGTPRLVYYTLELFNNRISGFDSVQDLNSLPEGATPWNWTWMVKFTKDDKDIFVARSDDGEKTIDLSPYISTPNVKITHIVVELGANNDPIYPPDEIMPTHSVKINETPIFIGETLLQMNISITKPEEGYLYIGNRKISPTVSDNTIIVRKITVEVNAYSSEEIEKVEFYVDYESKAVDYDEPYSWLWNEFATGRHEIKVVAYDNRGNKAENKINVIIFNFGEIK